MAATLACLRIRNLALVEELEWCPARGFNVLTGETGAGKSVIIGALTLLIGERGDKSLIRSGAEQCSVEAIFELEEATDINRLLEKHGVDLCQDSQLILRRVLTGAGTRQFVNGSACTLSLLKALGDVLVDLHGPHDHQSLFVREQQTRLLDAFAGSIALFQRYIHVRREHQQTEEKLSKLREDSQLAEREMDLLRHQISEIRNAQLDELNESELVAQHRAGTNANRILVTGAQVLALLNEEEGSLESCLADLTRQLKELGKLDERAVDFEARSEELLVQISELSGDVRHYLDAIEADPRRLNELEERLDILGGLKRKFGSTIDEILAFARKAEERLAELENREELSAGLQEALLRLDAEASELADQLTAKRKKAANKLAQAVSGHLADLNFAKSEFAVRLESLKQRGASGNEQVEFVFSPNIGEAVQPLRQIASSGEISRVMLAIKSALAKQDQISLMVFDEIDANVGGETASRVGEKMGELGTAHQIICITHLPQVAAAAPTHFRVEKNVQDGRTTSTLTQLVFEDRVRELTRMLGGGAAAKEHAEALLNLARFDERMRH